MAEIRTSFDTLTQREREVLDLVLAGRLNKQIAADIGIGLATVKARPGHVVRKMKTQSLTELVRMGDRLRPAPSKHWASGPRVGTGPRVGSRRCSAIPLHCCADRHKAAIPGSHPLWGRET
jgi:DNA-binding CsgD family transcriptional regulator